MRVEDASGLCAGESELSLTVSREVQLESITLAFSEGEIQDAINETLPYPQALATQSATLDPTQTLKVNRYSAHKQLPSKITIRATSRGHQQSQLRQHCLGTSSARMVCICMHELDLDGMQRRLT